MLKYFPLLGLFVCLQAAAQLPEDALRASWTTPSGTARQQAIGGAMGSIGGDLTSGYTNPAGLGLYKVSEFVLTPGWRSLKDKASYQGANQTGAAVNNFNLGTSGAVFAYGGRNPGVSNAFAITVNQTANFNRQVNYQGNNGYSSFSEQYVEEFASSGFGIEEGIGSPYLSYGTRMALYTSLIDTATIGGQLQVIGNPQKVGTLLQRNNLRTSGGITEINLALASSQQDKWYIGGSLGIPIMNYTQEKTWFESDVSGNTNNDFESFTYQERFTTKGWGLNFKLGAIYRPSNAFRFGAAIHTPTVFGLTDRLSASMVTRTEKYTNLPQVAVTSDQLDQITNLYPSPNVFKYDLYTPWHFLLSGSYLFGGGEKDFRQQKGFITADIEYVTTGSPHFGAAGNGDGTDGDDSYYNAVNQAIKDAYKGSFVGRLGGEMKFNTWMVRAGGSYYTSPYEGQGLKVDRATLSAGFGYRDKGYFIDLAYVAAFNRDIDVPYLLNDKVNTYAALKETGGTVLLTAGIKF
ncbi:MAG: hypothetical protein JST68_22875 [Bacteroidetes bacterium]|nr:hypothetical protein [Bacteroidota bacterium]